MLKHLNTWLLLALMFVGAPTARSQDAAPYASPLLLDVTPDNCGYDCAIVAASDLNLKISPDKIKQALGPGSEMYKALSLATLQKFFDDLHVGNVALGGLDAGALFEVLDRNQLAIVHILSRRGHYMVIRKLGAQYEVTNFPIKSIWDKQQLAQLLNKQMSGYALILSPVVNIPIDIKTASASDLANDVNQKMLEAAPPTRKVAQGDSPLQNAKAPSPVVEKGSNIRFESSVTAVTPSVYASEITAEEYIENIGSTKLTVLSASGECSCFKGIPEPITIEPSQKAKIVFRFDRGLFNFSEGTKVALRCTDRQLPVCIIAVNPPAFTAAEQNVPDLICIPEMVTIARSSRHNPPVHFLFLMDSKYPRSITLTRVLDADNNLLPLNVRYYEKSYYGQMYNVADLALTIRKLNLGDNKVLVETDHPRDNKIPLHIIVESLARE